MNASFLNFDQALDSLIYSAVRSFAFVPLELTPIEINCLDNLNIKPYRIRRHKFSYYGIFNENRLNAYLDHFILNELAVSSYSTHIVTKIILDKLIKPFILVTNPEAIAFNIKVSFPNTRYIIPKWRIDMTQPMEVIKYPIKLVGSLIGPSILFKQNQNLESNLVKTYIDEKQKLHKGTNHSSEIKNRLLIDQSLSKYKTYEIPDHNVAIYITGNGTNSAVFSNADIETTQLIFSLVPGTIGEIKQMAHQFGERFSI